MATKPRIFSVDFVLLLGLLLRSVAMGDDYVASISMSGINGSILFSAAVGSPTNVSYELSGETVANYTTVSVMSLPAVFGQVEGDPCSLLGSAIATFNITSDSGMTSLTEVSNAHVFHRSVLITGAQGTSPLCATILPSQPVPTFRAKFLDTVVGEIWIRHDSSTSSENDAYVFAELSLASSGAGSNLMLYGAETDSSTNSTSDDLFLSSVPVASSDAARGAKLSGQSATVTRTATKLQLFNSTSSTFVASADLVQVLPKTVWAHVNWDGVRGSINMTQASPFDATTTHVDISGLRSVPSAFHIHQFPVPQRLSDSEVRCSNDNVGGHHNPYAFDISQSPAASAGTYDQYEVGDLSGKYGKLMNSSVNEMYGPDPLLPLFGAHSVVGRSIVFHFPNGSRWLCASIGYPGPVKSAVVRFRSPVYGTMYFRQVIGDPYGDTSAYVELAAMNGTLTTQHKYHVHEYPMDKTCGSTGPHYNPHSVALGGEYPRLCSRSNPFRCEVGDLSGRHGGVTVATRLRSRQSKKYFTDVNLPLEGARSIIGKSIVIHVADWGGPRYACANITHLPATVLGVEGGTWLNGTAASITLTQSIEFETTQVSTSDLRVEEEKMMIYELPVPENPARNSSVSLVEAGDRCRLLVISTIYNPFGVATDPTEASTTHDKYKVGDLSGKHGHLMSSTVDFNLPLASPVSVNGRSIAIRSPGDVWKCNDLVEMVADSSTGAVVTATARFTGSLQGVIRLRQVVYDDGSASLTALDVDVGSRSSDLSRAHNWHVHIDPLGEGDTCGDVLGHYDPYSAKRFAYDNCAQDNQLACEVGDLSRKHAPYDIGGGRKVFNDLDLPLHTDKTVLGRSIVFHTRERGPARFACANIDPPITNTFTLAFPSSVVYDHYRFTSAVAATLGVHRMRVVVVHNKRVPVDLVKNGVRCSHVVIHVAGAMLSETQINRMFDRERRMPDVPDPMDPYRPTMHCVSVRKATVIGTDSEPSGGAAAATGFGYVVITALMTSFAALLLTLF